MTFKPAMSKSLKQKNQAALITFLLTNVVVLLIAALGWNSFLLALGKVLKGDLSTLGKVIALPTVTSVVVGMISWSLPRWLKETVIFWRTGARRLPSSEAFSKVGPSDHRTDMARLATRFSDLPVPPEKQSTLWYSIYRKHTNEPSVEDAHGAYLLYREMTALVLVLIAGTIVASVVERVSSRMVFFMCLGLLAEGCVVILAARNAGVALVANVLALESAAGDKASSPKRSAESAAKESLTGSAKTKKARKVDEQKTES